MLSAAPPTHSVLITGAAKRVGRLMAKHAAALGHRVIVHYNSSTKDAATVVNDIIDRGGNAVSVQADLSAPAQVRTLIARAADAIGKPVTALINNASVFEHDTPDAPNEAISMRAWRINYDTPVQLAAGIAAHGAGADDLVVINILDQKLWNLNPDFYSYTASKQALATATIMLDQQSPNGLRACAIAPGIHSPSPLQTEREFKAVSTRNLLKRAIDPNDIAAALGFILATPTFRGQILHIDNGERFVPSARDVSFINENNTEPLA